MNRYLQIYTYPPTIIRKRRKKVSILRFAKKFFENIRAALAAESVKVDKKKANPT